MSLQIYKCVYIYIFLNASVCILICIFQLHSVPETEKELFVSLFTIYAWEGGFCCSVIESCPTLCNPMDCSPPGSSVHRISQARILEWVAISYSRDLPDPGTKHIHVLCLLSLAGGFFISVPPWKPYYIASFHNFCTECFPHTFYLKLEFTKDTSLLVAHQTPVFSPYPVD